MYIKKIVQKQKLQIVIIIKDVKKILEKMILIVIINLKNLQIYFMTIQLKYGKNVKHQITILLVVYVQRVYI